MNTFSVIVLLLSSLGAVVAAVFVFLGLIIESLRDSVLKSLIAFVVMLGICVGSFVLCGETLPDHTKQSQSIVTTYERDSSDTTGYQTAEADLAVAADTSEADLVVAADTSEADLVVAADTSETDFAVAADTSTAENADMTKEELQLEDLQIHFIDVGQGDCTLITCNGKSMLIDAGDNSKGTAVQLYLEKHGITSLDYVIGTHPDADHIGGLDVVLTKFYCENIILPEVSNVTDTYRDVIAAMDYRKYKSILPVVGNTYRLGDASFTIIAPNRAYEDTNDNSVGIKLVHGENSFIFTGDAEEASEMDMLQNGMDLSADILKLGHHGSNSSTTPAFLEAVSPVYAVISCGEDNSYGHPSAAALNTLRSAGVKVYRTDEQGTIVAVSDGTNLSFNCSPSESFKAGEPSLSSDNTFKTSVYGGKLEDGDSSDNEETTTIQSETTVTYIINISTLKFHYADCSSVDTMAEKNKLPSNQTRDEIIAQGYVPCKRCNP